MKILNVGCGNSDYGTDRMDIVQTLTSNMVWDVNDIPWPYPDNYFDQVFMRNIFEHLPNPLKILQEAKRVLKKEGNVMIITDNAEYFIFHIGRGKKKFWSLGSPHGERVDYSESHASENDEDFHYGIYTIEHMRNFGNKAGLKEVRIWVDNFNEPSKLTNLIIFLGKYLYPRKDRFKPKLKAIFEK